MVETIVEIKGRHLVVKVYQNQEWTPKIELTSAISMDIQDEMIEKIKNIDEQELFTFLEALEIIKTSGVGKCKNGRMCFDVTGAFYEKYDNTKLADNIYVSISEHKL